MSEISPREKRRIEMEAILEQTKRDLEYLEKYAEKEGLDIGPQSRGTERHIWNLQGRSLALREKLQTGDYRRHQPPPSSQERLERRQKKAMREETRGLLYRSNGGMKVGRSSGRDDKL